jgi:sec-independent protein translocase protein TatA
VRPSRCTAWIYALFRASHGALAVLLTFEAAMSGVSVAIPLAFLSGMELFAVALIVLLLFGTRLPSVMRSLGVGITEFKKGISGEGLTEPGAKIEDKRHDDK